MRREEKEIKERSVIDDIINQANVMRLAMVDGASPYIVPLNFGYDGKNVYFHCATAGRKIDVLKANNKVCFEIEGEVSIKTADKPCAFSCNFKSVIGFGKVVFLEEGEEKIKGLSVIMNHYSEGMYDFDPEALKKTCVIRIDIDSITGKRSPKDS